MSTYAFVVGILMAIFIVVDLTERNQDFITNKPPLRAILLDYYGCNIPYWANMLSPLTIFIATIFVTARLAGRTEVIAILTGGVSFWRFLRPYLLGAAIIGVLISLLINFVIPITNRPRTQFWLKYIKQPFQNMDRNIHLRVADNTYAYLESFDNLSRSAYNFTIEYITGNDSLVSKIKADRAVWNPETQRWRLENYTLRNRKNGLDIVTYGSAMDTTLNLFPEDFDNQEFRHETLTTPQLNHFINVLQKRGFGNVMPYIIERYLRITYPFSIIILTCIGVILSARKSREGTGYQIALGFLLAFVYIIFFVLSRSIANTRAMDPLLACWLPNIVFSFIGVILYRTLPR